MNQARNKQADRQARLKVLHLGKYFPPYAGGMENYLRDLMVAQKRQHIDVSALVHQGDLGIRSSDETYFAGGQPLRITRAALWARVLFTPISPTFPWLLNRLIRKNPDILHIHMPNVSAFWALLLPGARRIPWVIHWHADVLASTHSAGLRAFYPIYRLFERALLRRSKAIVATSPPYLESSIPLQAYRDKCHVVPLGLSPLDPPIPAPPRGKSEGDRPLRVLAIGRMTYYKGFEYLIRAAAQIKNVEVHMVGKGVEEARLKSIAEALKLSSRITFHGQIADDQLARQISECDCLCLPSIERTEAFGFVLLEAMSQGKATVACNVCGSGMGWVVDDGVTGILVQPENTADLADALLGLQKNHGKLRTLGERGKAKFRELFHVDESAAGIGELYRHL